MAKSEALDYIHSLLKQNTKSCYAKRRSQRERWKNDNRSNCFARLQRETSRNFLVTRFVEEMSYLSLFFFTAAHFHLGWPLGFLIFTPLHNFHVVLPTNGSLSPALTLCRSFSR